jgi:hypothetical protein
MQMQGIANKFNGIPHFLQAQAVKEKMRKAAGQFVQQ